MEEKKYLIKTKKQMFIVIGAFALVMLLGTVTYAFFNYTRTGQENTIRTGRIAFNAEQSPAVTLSDLFPITLEANEEVTAQTPGVGVLSIHVTGDTDYNNGIEYLVKAVNVTGTSNVSLPISISIGYEASEGQGKTIGTADTNYFTNRGGNTSRYKVLSTNTISEGGDLVVGYIAPGNTGIDGNIIIMAYLDARNIAITDTYDESDPETDHDGTTTNWVNGRTVLTTQEWNEFQSSGTSFQVKVEANEGIWVTEPGTIPSCPGCKFVYASDTMYSTWNAVNGNATVFNSGVYDNYLDLMTFSGTNYFIGVKLDNLNRATNIYGCGVKGDVPFCVESVRNGTANSESTYVANKTLLQSASLWNNTCTESTSETIYVECGPFNNTTLSTRAHQIGSIDIGLSTSANKCHLSDGLFTCLGAPTLASQEPEQTTP